MAWHVMGRSALPLIQEISIVLQMLDCTLRNLRNCNQLANRFSLPRWINCYIHAYIFILVLSTCCVWSSHYRVLAVWWCNTKKFSIKSTRVVWEAWFRAQTAFFFAIPHISAKLHCLFPSYLLQSYIQEMNFISCKSLPSVRQINGNYKRCIKFYI